MQSYAEAIGQYLSAQRAAYGLTREAVARAGQRFGATWGAASIRNFEEGRAAPTLPAVLTLAAVLSELTGKVVSIDDLLGDAETLDGPTYNGRPIERRWVRNVLSGKGATLSPSDFTGGAASEIWLDAKALREVVSEFPQDFDFEALDRLHSPTVAEQRAASRLGVAPAAMSAWAFHLWGHSLDQEATLRAQGDTPQARGAASRALVREVEVARGG